MVRTIIEIAEHYKTKEQRIRLKSFTRMLEEEKNISLSSKTVGDILTANNLRSPKTRQKRPQFYQKLRREIPNGLVSIDGSEIEVHIGRSNYKTEPGNGCGYKQFCSYSVQYL